MEIYNNIKIHSEIPEGAKVFFKNANQNPATCSLVRIEEAGFGFVKVSMKIEENSKNPYGFVHGGMIFALADSCAGLTAATLGDKTVTLSSSINFISNAKEGKLHATPVLIHNGKSTKVVEVTVVDDHDNLVSKSSFTMFRVGDIEEFEEKNE